MVSVLSDCPTVKSWAGWSKLIWRRLQSCTTMTIAALYEKMAADMRDAQLPNGLVPAIARSMCIRQCCRRQHRLPRQSGVGTAIILSPWAAYQFYGDKRPLGTQLRCDARYAEYLKCAALTITFFPTVSATGTISVPASRRIAIDRQKPDGNCLYYQDLVALTARSPACSTSIRRTPQPYAAEARLPQRPSTAFSSTPISQQYDRGSQTANAIPVALGMVPEASRKAVLEHLVETSERTTTTSRPATSDSTMLSAR